MKRLFKSALRLSNFLAGSLERAAFSFLLGSFIVAGLIGFLPFDLPYEMSRNTLLFGFGAVSSIAAGGGIYTVYLEHKGPKLLRPPGFQIAAFLKMLLPRKKYDSIYGQLIADAREEHAEALKSGDWKEARRIAIWLRIDILKVVLLQISILPITALAKAWAIVKK